MADIQHSAIVDPNIHEPKGASSATSGHAYIADGIGSGAWAEVLLPGALTSAVTVMSGEESGNQGPTATDTAHRVKFGPGGTITGDITLAADGSWTVVNAGTYIFYTNLTYGRTSSTGTAQVSTRLVVNGVQAGPSGDIWLANNDVRLTKSNSFKMDLSAADVLYLEIIRDSAGNNDGGLYANTITAVGWNTVPSAHIVAYKLQS